MARTKRDAVFEPSELCSREKLADLLNVCGLTGNAVEVGTHLGEFAHSFLAAWRGRRLWCVDPWKNLPGYVDVIAERPDREADFLECRNRLAEFGDRCSLLRATSAEAATFLASEPLDFVYLDADHSYEAINEDLRLWWPLVKNGGVLAGHDLNNDWAHTVGRAVREFCHSRKLTCFVVPGAMESWYVFKE